MAVICPTVTAFEPHTYRTQMERIEPFANRVHIDLMDGKFAPTVSPGLDQIWWTSQLVADIHLMYQNPENELAKLIELQPHLVIIHAEADVDHMAFAAKLHAHDIKAGLAILQTTAVEDVQQIMHSFDHILIFSGDLGKHGGHFDDKILYKVKKSKQLHPDAEIGWDGGVNDRNARLLVDAGADVLNVGGFIQKAEDPEAAYNNLSKLL
jgi:ribulose-phosphate 3-epimerase